VFENNIKANYKRELQETTEKIRNCKLRTGRVCEGNRR
jgi:hypothetical protein